MSPRQNTTARGLAPIALIVTLVAIIVVIGSSTGGDEPVAGNRANGNQAKSNSDNDNKNNSGVQNKAIKKGFYVVEEGDTLVDISSRTGVSVEDLQALNEDLDPQRLQAGDRVLLRSK